METGITSSLKGHLARMQTLSLPNNLRKGITKAPAVDPLRLTNLRGIKTSLVGGELNHQCAIPACPKSLLKNDFLKVSTHEGTSSCN